MGEPNRSAAQQKLELEAYTAVLRALAATAMDWSKERLMTEIRRELHISTEEHFTVLSKVMEDEEITAIREGRPLPMTSSYATPVAELPSRRSAAAAAAAGGSSERRGPGRPPNSRGRLTHASGEPAAPALRKRGKHRSSGAAPGGHVNELIGRTIWRHWPMEQVAWAKGMITDYKPSTNEHTVVYDINTPDESWEEINLTVLRPGVDYELAQDGDVRQLVTPAAPPMRSGSMSRSQKRKAAGAPEVPYPQPVLQERLAGGSAPELEGMRDALDARARDLVAELVSMAAPATAYPDLAERLQLQLEDVAAREARLRAAISAC